MGIIDEEPNRFILMLMDLLEKLHIIEPTITILSKEEIDKFKKMMEEKGFHFEEEVNK